MLVKNNVPILITEEAIKLGHGWVALFIAPGELPVLEVNFFELTEIEGVSEASDAATVCIGTVLVSSAVDLVEVARHKPSRALMGLKAHKLLEKGIFEVSSSSAIYRSEIEHRAGADHFDACRMQNVPLALLSTLR